MPILKYVLNDTMPLYGTEGPNITIMVLRK